MFWGQSRRKKDSEYDSSDTEQKKLHFRSFFLLASTHGEIYKVDEDQTTVSNDVVWCGYIQLHLRWTMSPNNLILSSLVHVS